MVIILAIVILLLLFVIVWLNIDFYKEKRNFKHRIETLHQVIAEITSKQRRQQDDIKLSEEFDQTMKSSKSVLSNDIFSLNYELFDMLSKNNLLKNK